MYEQPVLTRRDLLRLGGMGALSLLIGRAAHTFVGSQSEALAVPHLRSAEQPSMTAAIRQIHLAVTDGYISIPGRTAPLYILGLKSVPWDTSLEQITSLHKGQAQMTSPIAGLDQEGEFSLRVTNLGRIMRPDLGNAQTVHWHGLHSSTSVLNGEPAMSLTIPVGRSFTYVFRPRQPGTSIYQCHFEDMQHVQMAISGTIYVRPVQNYTGAGARVPIARLGGNTDPTAPLGYAHNDGDGSTAYDREFSLLLTEIDTRQHDLFEAVQGFVLSEYEPQYWMINGRAYPDTVATNGSVDPGTGVLDPPPGALHLRYQPISALVQANAGERVLLRFAHLGYQPHNMQLVGIPMKVISHDTPLMCRPDGVALAYWTNSMHLAPSASRDVLFTAPAFDPGALVNRDAYGDYNLYWLRNRNHHRQTNNGLPGLGGMMTEVRVYNGGLPPQTYGHQIFV